MAEWNERLDQSDIPASTDEIVAKTEDFAPRYPDQAERLTHLRDIAALARYSFDQADPARITRAIHDNLANPLRAIVTALQNFEGTGDASHLDEAMRQGDLVLGEMPYWGATAPGDIDTLRSQVRGLKAWTTTTSNEIEEQIAQIRNELAAASEAISTERDQRLDAQELAISERISAIEARATELDERISAENQRITDALGRFETQFGEDQTARRAELDALLESAKSANASEFERAQGASETLLETTREQTDDLLDEITEKRDRAAELVGLIGVSGQARAYQTRGDTEQRQATRWRLAAVAFGLLAVVVLAIAVIAAAGRDKGEEINEPLLAAKIGLTAALGALSTYAARQGHRHLDAADDARTRELALRSLPAYLEPLDDDRRQAMIETLAFVYFGPPEPKLSEKSKEAGAVSFASQLLDFATRATKKVE